MNIYIYMYVIYYIYIYIYNIHYIYYTGYLTLHTFENKDKCLSKMYFKQKLYDEEEQIIVKLIFEKINFSKLSSFFKMKLYDFFFT